MSITQKPAAPDAGPTPTADQSGRIARLVRVNQRLGHDLAAAQTELASARAELANSNDSLIIDATIQHNLHLAYNDLGARAEAAEQEAERLRGVAAEMSIGAAELHGRLVITEGKLMDWQEHFGVETPAEVAELKGQKL